MVRAMSERFQTYELIAFDWDGTLFDSAACIVSSMQAAARELGLEPPSDAQARQVIGLGLEPALQQAVPTLPRERYRELAEAYRRHYFASRTP
jgi:phosphoglycolate phosphatase